MSFIDNLDALIALHHLTQDEIARSAGVTPGAVSGWRNGSTPRKGALKNLCDAYGLTEDDLLSDALGLGASPKTPAKLAPPVAVPLISGVDPTREMRSARQFVEVPAHAVEGRPHAYALVAKDDGMSQVIPVGSHVIVDPDDLCPENGTAVAFKFTDLQSIDLLWTSDERIQLRIWYVGVTHLMLSPQSYREKLEDIVMRLEDADSSIEMLGSIVWFQSAGMPR